MRTRNETIKNRLDGLKYYDKAVDMIPAGKSGIMMLMIQAMKVGRVDSMFAAMQGVVISTLRPEKDIFQGYNLDEVFTMDEIKHLYDSCGMDMNEIVYNPMFEGDYAPTYMTLARKAEKTTGSTAEPAKQSAEPKISKTVNGKISTVVCKELLNSAYPDSKRWKRIMKARNDAGEVERLFKDDKGNHAIVIEVGNVISVATAKAMKPSGIAEPIDAAEKYYAKVDSIIDDEVVFDGIESTALQADGSVDYNEAKMFHFYIPAEDVQKHLGKIKLSDNDDKWFELTVMEKEGGSISGWTIGGDEIYVDLLGMKYLSSETATSKGLVSSKGVSPIDKPKDASRGGI